MAPASKAVVLKRAIARVAKLERQLTEDVRLILDARTEKCDDACPGWFIGDRGPERCDDCARLNGYAGEVDDGTIGLLPEVCKAAHERDSNAEQDQPTRSEAKIIAWLRANVKCRRPDVPELADKEAVQLAAHLLGASPTWLAERMVGRK
ncbi:MAG TPA: hypothetical protein VJZ73_13395 [Methylomirabilota bacterium]|nr:hypothetical protein [Methylomirabilota bacterium]